MHAQKFKEKIIISDTLFGCNQLLADYFEVFPVVTIRDIDCVLEDHHDIGAILLDQLRFNEWLSLTRRLKMNAATFHCVIIIFVSNVTLDGLAQALEAGADDYISVPATPHELVARIIMNLRRSQRDQNANPLTKLPGNGIIMHTIQERLFQPWALLWIDLDNFKAYNDYYGFARGDELLQKTANIIVAAVKQCGCSADFVGHLGGDDFMVISTPPYAPILAQKICSAFDFHAINFYDEKD
ncbi:MAG: diguanylate cyclase, partial [Candidatus Babeliales bacterium]